MKFPSATIPCMLMSYREEVLSANSAPTFAALK